MWPVIAAAGIGAVASYLGQQETNQSNATIARQSTDANMIDAQRNRDFQAQQANAQMAFQERMANTTHQRQVADLKKAGLNPILAAQSGAPAPGGAAGSGAQGSAVSAQMQNPLAHMPAVLTTALEAATMLQGLDKQQAETQFIKAQTGRTGVETERAKKDLPASELKNDIYDLIRPFVKKTKEALSSRSSKGTPYDKSKYNLNKAHKNATKPYLGPLR